MSEKTAPSASSEPIFFEMREEGAAFNHALAKGMAELQGQFVKQRLSEENTLRYSHGRQWSHRANREARQTEMKVHSAEWSTKFEDLVDGDLTLIPKMLAHVSQELERQMMGMVYQTVSDACDETGNVVSQKEAGSFPAVFMEMMKKIEFGVDRQGNVSLPEIHMGGDARKLIDELEAQPPEYKEEFERIKAEKTAQALQREAERKRKFRSETA